MGGVLEELKNEITAARPAVETGDKANRASYCSSCFGSSDLGTMPGSRPLTR